MVVMAEKHAGKGKGGRPKGPEPKRSSVSLKGSTAWRDWLNDLAEHCHMPATVVIDQALIMYAKANNYGEPMPPR